jgi:NAD(P)-dependent dehydrogenase (short-subunit alcohol dehydrogenase family)
MSPASAADPVVLLTGASTGIGLALARRLVATSCRVVLTARASSLRRLSDVGLTDGERLLLVPLDVTVTAQREAAVRAAEERFGPVDVLINNAAVSYRAVVEHISEEEFRRELETNFVAPLALARLVLPGMRQVRRGRIINVSSVSGMMAMPTMASYSASKFALEGATESLWYEMRPWNIHVSLIQPGFVRSDGFAHVLLNPDAERAKNDPTNPYYRYYAAMAPFIARLMARAVASPDDVARVILRTMTRPRPPLRVAGTLDARVYTLLRRLLPRWLYHRVLYYALPEIRRWRPELPSGK